MDEMAAVVSCFPWGEGETIGVSLLTGVGLGEGDSGVSAGVGDDGDADCSVVRPSLAEGEALGSGVSKGAAGETDSSGAVAVGDAAAPEGRAGVADSAADG